jgi:phosphate transport system substrate-binding protein
MLFYENPEQKPQARTMVDFMRWALTDGQQFAVELGYSPLPENVVQMELKALERRSSSRQSSRQ